jgi:Ser/Thr protein kinase RdoA (MazF antagonist)
MQAIIGNILNRDVILLPIGNHELRRHLVYKVKTDEGDFVFKYYYQDTYGGREISTLKLLENTDIKHAKLIDSGTFGQDREWLMMELLDGMPMDKIMKCLPEEELLEIYTDMGRELAKIHELKVFDHFGSLDGAGSHIQAYDSFKDAFIQSNKYFFDKVRASNLDAKDYLMHAIKIVGNNLDLLDHVTEARMTHFDYSPRNIFIGKSNGKRFLKAVLDFELCRPWDKNYDFIHLMLRDFPDNTKLESAFFKGYKEFSHIDPSFHKTVDLYMLTLCINVCSWAEDIAPDYYKMAYNKLIKLISESKNLK